MRNPAKNPLQWRKVANEDLSAAHFLLQGLPESSGVICFLCQQSSEKNLKAFLCANQKEIPRTHDLKMLCALCRGIDPSFSDILVFSARLSIYAVKIRYPHSYLLTKETLDTAISDANSIQNFIEQKLNQGYLL